MENCKNRRIRFAVDIDDVLRCLLCEMVCLYNDEFGETMTCGDVLDYDVSKSFPKAEEKYGSATRWFFSENAKLLFKGSKPVDGSVEAINRLCEIGDVCIVTKQHGLLNKVYTLEWLEECGIRYNSVCFVDDKSVVRCDYMIDDYQENFRGVGCGTCVLIDAPYNVSFTDDYVRDISGCSEVLRFGSISDFVRFYETEK